MELMQLEMFVAVAEEGTVRKAAARVHRTQPAVSMALRKLEQEVRASLLDRSDRRDYRLTRAGRVLYDYATRMLDLRDRAGKGDGAPRLPSGRKSVGLASNASGEGVKL
ncbi:MAG TPA: LysR family transcriptional regulator [Candidatus Acidoferrales bacterium]|nr:LysR family transcriptional regulator [Candidatus Acidoferrales bacterium]